MQKTFAFIKYHRFDILVTLSVFAFIYDLTSGFHLFSVTAMVVYCLGYAADVERSKNDVEARLKLSRRGLTPEDLSNIRFVKKWEDLRRRGHVKYSLIDGGIFGGFALCFIFNIVCLILIKGMIKNIAASPANMLNFIEYTYIAGVIAGTILFRVLWIVNERRFFQLTDPVHYPQL